MRKPLGALGHARLRDSAGPLVRFSGSTAAMALACALVLGCAGKTEIAGAPCDDEHPCPAGFNCVEGLCVGGGPISCSGDEDCPVGYCDPGKAQCVTCVTNSHCPAGVCHPDANICVGCLEDSHCQGGVCLPQSRTCVGCRVHADCATGLCNIRAHVCLGCKSDLQCPSAECDEQTGFCKKSSTEVPTLEQGATE